MTDTATVRSEETQKSQVDDETTERFIAEKHIGERIKRLRLKKSMGLVELGKHTGLSASFLSQLETGRVVPTLRNLARIAMVFSKDLSYFFETEPNSIFRVHRRKDRVRLPQTGVEEPSYYFESLGYMVPDRHMDPVFRGVRAGWARRRSRSRTCIRAMSSFTCWTENWGCSMVSIRRPWCRAMRSTSIRVPPTPTRARAPSPPAP